ncbi:hypothetical protein L6V77_28800 [Myxococcota bacterium]|nr:hypothetical protein [Myxococcota bacterium]
MPLCPPARVERPAHRRHCLAFLTVTATLLAGACGEAGDDGTSGAVDAGGGGAMSAPVPDLTGKADGTAPLSERGRLVLPLAANTPVEIPAEVTDRRLAWRVRGYAGMVLRLDVRAPDGVVDPYVAVDGPLPGGAGRPVAYADDGGAPSTRDAALEVAFPETGAYRIQLGDAAHFFGGGGGAGAGRLTLTATCLSGCTPREWSLNEVLADVEAKVGREQLRAMVSQGIAALFPDAETAASIQAQADAALAGDAAGGAPLALPEAFPIVPIAAIGTAQALLERPGAPVPAPGAVTFDLGALLTEDCRPARSSLKPLHPSLPDLQTGSAPDYTFDDCLLQRAQDFANVLNNLSLENGSAVVSGATRYETVEDVFTALIDGGHHIVVQNNRYFADFLGLSYKGEPVEAPVWLDTGIPLTTGGTFPLPAPHTHHTIIVSGPVVNATIMYYMGVSGGVSFRAVEGARPAWSGERTLYTYDSAVDPDAVVRLMVAAADLRRKWTTAGAGLPALGYGQLGVCNDSTAVLEHMAQGSVTIFPLAHPASDATQGADGDAIDRALAALPSDLAGFDPTEAAARIRTTLPFADAASLPFPGLAAAVGALP